MFKMINSLKYFNFENSNLFRISVFDISALKNFVSNLVLRASNFTKPKLFGMLFALLLLSVPAISFGATLRTPPNNLGLVGYWSMEDGRGSTATDFSGSGNSGTLTNMDPATDWVSGRRGAALELDGSDDYVNFGSVGSSINTFSFWIKPTTDNQYITQLNGSTNVQISSGSIQANGFSSPTIYVDGQNSSSVSIGEWNHVTITIDSAVNVSDLQSGIVEGAGSGGGGTPSHDATSDSGGVQSVSNSDTISFSHSVSGSDRILLVSVAHDSSSDIVSSVSYGGNSMTRVVNVLSTDTSVDIYQLIAPPTGSNTVSVDFGGSSGITQVAASSYTSADQTNGTGATNTNTGSTDISTSITPDSSDSLIFDGVGHTGGSSAIYSAGSGQTARWTQDYHKGSTEASGGGSVTMSWDETNDNPWSWGHALTEILPASGSSDAYFAGKLDNMRMYNRKLSASEVRDLYQSGYAEINRTDKVEEAGDPVGWWTFDGKDMDFSGSGGTSTDASDNGNDGSLQGGMSNQSVKPGRIGQALEFDGSDDSVDISGFGTSDGSVTIATWIKASNWSGENEIVFWGDGSPQFELWDSSSDVLDFIYYDGSSSGIDAGITLPSTGEWHHIAGTYDDSTGDWKLFVDGVEKKSVNDPINPSFSGSNSLIGAHPSAGRYFDGKIDDTRVYDKALSTDEIQKLYDATRPSEVNASQDNELTDGLVGMWSFDGPSMDFSGSTSTAADVSSNSNTGTLQGDPAGAIGNIGQALSFGGRNDSVNIGDIGSGVQTFSFWVKPTEDNQYITQLNGSTNVQISSGSIQANGFSSPTIYVDGQNSSSVSIGEWNHVTITIDSAVNVSDLQSGIVEGVGDPTPLHENTSVFGPKDVSSGETITFSHSNSGSDRMLLVGTKEITGSNSVINSVEYGGNSLSQVESETLTVSGLALTNTMWRLDSPPTGDNDVAVNFGGFANSVEVAASSFSQAGGIGATKTNNTGGAADSISTTITPNSADSLVLDGAAAVGGTVAGENQVVRWTISEYRGSTKVSDGSSLTMSWTNDNGNSKTQVLSEILPASSNPPAYFAGKLDNIRAYDRVLSSDEVKRLYRLGR